MVLYCIIKIITEETNSKVIKELENYVINGINSGPLLFKFLTLVITINTRATITNRRMDLNNFNTYILIVKFDINKLKPICQRKEETS